MNTQQTTCDSRHLLQVNHELQQQNKHLKDTIKNSYMELELLFAKMNSLDTDVNKDSCLETIEYLGVSLLSHILEDNN